MTKGSRVIRYTDENNMKGLYCIFTKDIPYSGMSNLKRRWKY